MLWKHGAHLEFPKTKSYQCLIFKKSFSKFLFWIEEDTISNICIKTLLDAHHYQLTLNLPCGSKPPQNTQ